MLVGRQESHPACRKLDVDCDDLTGALHVLQLQLSPPPPSSLAPIKPAKPGSPGKMAVKTERRRVALIMGLSLTVSEINDDIRRNWQIFLLPVIHAIVRGLTVRIWYAS